MACDDESIRRRIDRILRGLDPDRNYQRIYACFFGPLQRFFRRFQVPEEDGRDLAQETLLRGFQNLSTFRRGSKFATWLFRIARNLTKNYWRDRNTAKRSAFEVSTADLLEGGREIADQDQRAEPLGDPHGDAVRRERARLVGEAIAQLPPRMRRCVELTLQGRTQAEIAFLMDLKEGTVKAQMSQARKKLRELLDPLLGPEAEGPETGNAVDSEGKVAADDASEGDALEDDPRSGTDSEDEERRES